MPAPDPTIPEVQALLQRLGTEELQKELDNWAGRLSASEQPGYDADQSHIIHTWTNAIRAELDRRASA